MKPTNNEKNLPKMIVCVSVATVWTEPTSPRYIDQLAVNNPVDMPGWIKSATYAEQLALCKKNLVQTQLLYGTEVMILEEKDEWAHVLIPSQESRKDDRGYPGWVPMRQLSSPTIAYDEGALIAQVTSPIVTVAKTAQALKKKNGDHGLAVSFLTRFPVVKQTEEFVEVVTPHGNGYLKTDDVRLFTKEDELLTHQDQSILEVAKQFLGLPYLWGGMSAFGFDCSGFAYSMYRYYGITLPRDASDQVKKGTVIEREDLQVGDLLFFAYEKGKGAVHHVGMYAGDDQMIHSPKTGKSIEIIPLTNSSYEEELIGGRRYLS
ncbi:C40 family peptidase [Alkalihalobacillus sp. MEB130]|uniref:C40 family peptidase n=1 Tax=Alkalihalobacillus sp. MEB130 TaxID=2976704 RepID=UPI0028DDCF57|nr:C40 family peptidase [Alkalihalobacillus sp. MEB130]MDT8861884.1 C40 family peptidase [Alkalihalobacillus sp. MEB130]